MASDNLVTSVEVSSFPNLAAEIEADVAARQTEGYSLVNCVPFHVVDNSTGDTKWIALISYSTQVGGGGGVSGVVDVTELKAITPQAAGDNVFLFSETAYYYFDPNSGAADNPPSVIKPDDIMSGSPGRWIPVPTGPAVMAEVDFVEVPFTFADGPQLAIYSYLVGEVIFDTELIIDTPFDDPSATLALGPDSDLDGIIDENNNIPDQSAVYSNRANLSFIANETIRLSINPGTSTQGSGRVALTVKKT